MSFSMLISYSKQFTDKMTNILNAWQTSAWSAYPSNQIVLYAATNWRYTKLLYRYIRPLYITSYYISQPRNKNAISFSSQRETGDVF